MKVNKLRVVPHPGKRLCASARLGNPPTHFQIMVGGRGRRRGQRHCVGWCVWQMLVQTGWEFGHSHSMEELGVKALKWRSHRNWAFFTFPSPCFVTGDQAFTGPMQTPGSDHGSWIAWPGWSGAGSCGSGPCQQWSWASLAVALGLFSGYWMNEWMLPVFNTFIFLGLVGSRQFLCKPAEADGPLNYSLIGAHGKMSQ